MTTNPVASDASEKAGPFGVLVVGGLHSHAGKTGLVAAIGLKLAYEGRRVLALRLSGEDDDAEAAQADAVFLQSLPFARGRGGHPVSVKEASSPASEQAQIGGLLILEAPDGADLPSLAGALNGIVVVCGRAADADALQALDGLASSLGSRLLGLIALAVPSRLIEEARAALTAGPVPVLGLVPEEIGLYAPSVLEIADVLDAEIILGEPAEGEIIERMMIGPVTVDPGQPYYARPRGRRAVITRSDKTDLQLAAMHTAIDCLILTGGMVPSPYTIDRAADAEVRVLLTKADTRGAVDLLEDIYRKTRFSGEEKLETMLKLLDEHLDWQPLMSALAVDTA